MKKSIIWTLFFIILAGIISLVFISDEPMDESEKYINIEKRIGKNEMVADIDSIVSFFESVHPKPYRFQTKEQLTNLLASKKQTLPDSLELINFWRLVDELLCNYDDAHSYAKDFYVLTDYVQKGKLFFPLSVKIQDDKFFVSETDSSYISLKKGTQITNINGVEVTELINQLSKHCSKETKTLDVLEISEDFGFYLWKAYDWDKDFEVFYLPDSNATKIDSIKIEGIKWEDRKVITKNNSSFSFEFLKNNQGYMKITDFNGDRDEINDFYEKSFNKMKEKQTQNLILDFRGHSGGSDQYGEDLAKYIATKPFKKLSKAYWKITPEFKNAFDRKFVPKGIQWFEPIYLINEYSENFYGANTYDSVIVEYELKEPLPKEKRFLGNVYLITDHNTFSAGSIFAEMFKYYNLGTVVGQPTGNLCSFSGFALSEYVLPNSKLSFQVSSVYNLSNNKEEGLKTVEPTIFVPYSENPIDYILNNLIE